jgi:hypothetical protein
VALLLVGHHLMKHADVCHCFQQKPQQQQQQQQYSWSNTYCSTYSIWCTVMAICLLYEYESLL